MTAECWIGLSLDSDSGLILAARVGKHTYSFIEELVNSSEGKTDCLNWKTDGWGGYQRVLPEEVQHEQDLRRGTRGRVWSSKEIIGKV